MSSQTLFFDRKGSGQTECLKTLGSYKTDEMGTSEYWTYKKTYAKTKKNSKKIDEKSLFLGTENNEKKLNKIHFRRNNSSLKTHFRISKTSVDEHFVESMFGRECLERMYFNPFPLLLSIYITNHIVPIGGEERILFRQAQEAFQLALDFKILLRFPTPSWPYPSIHHNPWIHVLPDRDDDPRPKIKQTLLQLCVHMHKYPTGTRSSTSARFFLEDPVTLHSSQTHNYVN